MELKLTRIWSLNHYSNRGATAGQMPKGRLVPRHWGGVRHSISYRPSHCCHQQRGWSPSLPKGPQQEQSDLQHQPRPTDTGYHGCRCFRGAQSHTSTLQLDPWQGLDQLGRGMATGPVPSGPPAPGTDDLTAREKLHQQQGGKTQKRRKRCLVYKPGSGVKPPRPGEAGASFGEASASPTVGR